MRHRTTQTPPEILRRREEQRTRRRRRRVMLAAGAGAVAVVGAAVVAGAVLLPGDDTASGGAPPPQAVAPQVTPAAAAASPVLPPAPPALPTRGPRAVRPTPQGDAVDVTRRPVVVQALVAAPATLRLEVLDRSGHVVAHSAAARVSAGRTAFRWDGSRGAGGARRVPDGRYALRLVDSTGAPSPATPRAVAVDTRPPVVGVRTPVPTLPLTAWPVVAVGVRDAGGDTDVRAIVRAPWGGPAVRGPWRPARGGLPVPRAALRLRTVGPVTLTVQARDAAGHRSASEPVAVSLPSPPGPARVVRSVVTRRPFVALVFDDGLDGPAMLRILRVLAAHDAGATFCLNGVNAGGWGAEVRRAIRLAVADGRLELCSHGYSHRTGTTTTLAGGLGDLTANLNVDRALGISAVPLYRPPYGALGPGLTAAAGQLGYRWIVMWNVDPSDYRRPGARVLAARVVGPSRRGSIAVMHAIGPTADALPAILTGLRRKGLRAVTAGRLLASGRPSG